MSVQSTIKSIQWWIINYCLNCIFLIFYKSISPGVHFTFHQWLACHSRHKIVSLDKPTKIYCVCVFNNLHKMSIQMVMETYFFIFCWLNLKIDNKKNRAERNFTKRVLYDIYFMDRLWVWLKMLYNVPDCV